MVLVLCTFSNDIVSMYQVLFHSLLYGHRNKLNIANIRKESTSVNTRQRVTVLAFCNLLMAFY